MTEHIVHHRLYGVILMSSFIFLSDMLSLKGKRLDFYGRGDTHVSLTNTVPELSRCTACIDLVFRGDTSSSWIAFSYITNNRFRGREDIDLGLAGNRQQLIIYNLGKAFHISYHLIPLQWHTICLIWDGVKGRLELFLNKERILVIMDQPHNLPPNGTLVLGHFRKKGVGHLKPLIPRFTGSLYYFQLWDRILENEEFMKCLGGNVVSWEADVWLVNKIIPTVDRRLRCFVSENMTIQETSTTLSQQIELTTPSQVTGLKPQTTVHYSTVMSKSLPVFVTDYATISYSNATVPSLETTTTSKMLTTSIAETATFAVDTSSTSTAMTSPTQSISICNATDSMQITKSPSSESTRPTEIVQSTATKTFHPTTATNFLSTSLFSEDSIASQTSATESQSVITKMTSLFATTESTSMSPTSWPKHKPTDIAVSPISTSEQEFLVSTAAGTVPWSIVGGTSGKSTGIRTTSAFTPKSLLSSIAASADSVFPRNQTVSTLATTNMEKAFTIHSMMPTGATPTIITAETELPSTNFQNISLSHVEDAVSTFMPQETSSLALSPMKSFPITETQSVQTGFDAESPHPTLTPGITLAQEMTEAALSPIITGPVYTQKTPPAGEHMFTSISTISAPTVKAFEPGPTSLTDETAHWLSSEENAWTSRPDQMLLTRINSTTVLTFVSSENVTSAFHVSTTNPENSSTTTNLITPPEFPTESNATGVRYMTTLSTLTSPWLGNFSSISGTTSGANLPQFKLTTLLKTIPGLTVAANELSTIPGEEAVSPVDTVSTHADIKLNFSIQESTSESTHTESDGTIASGVTTVSVPKSATTLRSNNNLMTKETTSHHLKGKSTVAAISEVSLFPTVLKVTDESAQTVTASVTLSPFPGVEKLTTSLDNKIATAELEGSWISTTLMKTMPTNSYNGTPENFNSTHAYPTHWTSETSEGPLALSSTPESTKMFPEPLHTFTTRIIGASIDRTAKSWSSAILSLKTAASHSSATHIPITHIFSLPVTVSPATSMVVSGEAKVTIPVTSNLAMDFLTSMPLNVVNLSSATMTSALVPPLSQTTSVTNDIIPTQTDSINTTSEATVMSSMTLMSVPSQTETLVPLLRSPIPITTKTKVTLPSTSGDTVTPSTHTLVCSKPAAVSSTHAISTMSTSVATQPISQVDEIAPSTLSFPFTFSGSGDAASLAIGTTETPTVAETMPSHTSSNKLIASADVYISHSSTHLVNMSASTQLATGISTLPSAKDEMTISLGKTSRTMEVTEMSPSKNSFISYSKSTSSLEMTDAEFSETTEVSSYQTYSASEIPFETPTDENSTTSTTSKGTWTTPSLTSNYQVDVHISEMPNSLGKTTPPSQALTKTTFLPPEKENTSALSMHTPRTVEKIANSSSGTHQDASFVNTTSRTANTSNPEFINSTLSQFSSLKTPPEVTSFTSSISESIPAFPKSLSPSTAGLSNSKFTVVSNNRITTTLSVPNVPTLLRETPAEMSIPISEMSTLPGDVTAFTFKTFSDPLATIMTKSSKTTYPGCFKSPSVATSVLMPEIASIPVSDFTFSPAAVSSDTSTLIESFSTSLSPATPRMTVTTQASTLNVTPVIYPRLTSKSTVASSASTTSEMTDMSSRITPTSISIPTEATFLSMKTTPITTMAGPVTSVLNTTASPLLRTKNTEATSSIPKTTSFPSVLTTLKSPQEDEATPLGILSGITTSSISTVSNGRTTAFTNTHSRTPSPETVLSSTPLANPHTTLNIQVSPSWTNSKITPGPTESIKATSTYLSSNTGKMISLLQNTSLTTEFTKRTTSEDIPVVYPSWTRSSETTPSLISLLYSPHGAEARFSTPKISPTSQVVGFPGVGTKITSSKTQSLLMTSWKTHRAEDSQFPLSTTTHRPIPNKMETETPHLVPGTLSPLAASPASLVSKDAIAASTSPTSGMLTTLGTSENLSLSTSLRSTPTSWPDKPPILEKTTTYVTPRTTVPPNPLISMTTTSPMLTFLSSLPSGSMLMTAPHAVTSSMAEVSKSTFPTDTIPMYAFTNFTKLPFATGSTMLNKITSTPTLGSSTTGPPTSLPMSTQVTDNRMDNLTSLKTTSRAILTGNSGTMFQSPSFSGMSVSPSTSDHPISFGSMLPPSPTEASAWSRIPATSAPPSLILPKSTLESLINITTTTSTTARAPSPFISTGLAYSSTDVVSSLISSSFKATWLDSTFSFLTTKALTSPTASESIVSFYNIEMKFSVFDEESRVPITSVIHEFVKNWLNFIFEDSEFCLANLAVQIKSRGTSKEEMALFQSILERREGQAMATISHVPYSCACQVIIKASSSLEPTELISRIRNKIYGNLTHGNFTQDELVLLVKSDHVVVKKLEPGKCKADETPSKYKGTYKWLLTNPTETAQTRCIKNEDGNATRICSISIQTGKSQWAKPRLKQCKLLQGLPDKIVDLANITINDENADDVAEHILNLINESPPLDEEETRIIVSKIAEISKCDEISMNLTQIILQIITAVSEKQNDSTSHLHQVSNVILKIIERAGHKMEFSGRTANVTVSGLALAVLRVGHGFQGMAFSIRSYKDGTTPEIYLGAVPLEKTLASIYLPNSLSNRIPLNNLQTILFSFFGQTSLFKITNVTKALTSYVVSASISNAPIQNLADPVVITLQHIEGKRNYDQVHCAFWDFETNNGLGGWNSSGCKVKETNINYTVCQCDHLTHFGVLMDLSRSTVDPVNERILVIITYSGCGISSIFLGIAMVTYIAFYKLRKDYPSKILINLCTALLMLNLVFLVNSSLSSVQNVGLCVTAAVALHYFLLVSLTWMGLEAVHMYFALVKVFNIYIPNYILKFCLVGWGVPAITVAILLTVRKDLYGTLSPTTLFCWIKDDSIFYISVVAYFCLIFFVNLSMFCTVLAQLNSMKSQRQKTRRKMILRDLKGILSLTFLLGLTWGFAFFAWGPVRIFFLYLFAICNSLQGFLIFVFYCVMKESVREQWHIHLRCGWLRLDNFSDGSRRFGGCVGYKQKRVKKAFEHKLLTPSLKSTATSCTFKSLDCIQDTPSEISFSNDDFDEDPYCLSPLSCKVMPNCQSPSFFVLHTTETVWTNITKDNPMDQYDFLSDLMP
ncbi:adhesion G-protein coupled receptor G4 [Octodon degus]|uniref:Adhesion G-protein coupled receptor G4 n=1 Tax=Octodon degus TaxID=10160 RepID=A0A6P3FQL1_OCTDE|nr:adhesion G-protein coupled receptor G4 [Octodon degus]